MGSILDFRQPDLTGSDPENQGTGTRSFSSANQFRTMLICDSGGSGNVVPAAFLLDAEQNIRWIAVSSNQVARLTYSEILEVIEAAGKY